MPLPRPLRRTGHTRSGAGVAALFVAATMLSAAPALAQDVTRLIVKFSAAGPVLAQKCSEIRRAALQKPDR